MVCYWRPEEKKAESLNESMAKVGLYGCGDGQR